MPANLTQRVAAWQAPQYPDLVIPWMGGLYGWLRDWMGVENLSYVMHDDRPWFEEMVATLADCTYGALGRASTHAPFGNTCATTPGHYWTELKEKAHAAARKLWNH